MTMIARSGRGRASGIGQSRGNIDNAADQKACRATRDGDVGVAEHAKSHCLEVRKPMVGL